MTVMECEKLSNQQQITQLKQLGQQSAAYMVGCSARALREHYIPRNIDGTYDAAKVVEWARQRVPIEQLSDDELERLLVVNERFHHDTCAPLHELVRDMLDQHGEAAYAMLGKALADEWVHHYETDNDDEYAAIPSIDELEALDDSEARQLVRQRAMQGLRVKIRCSRCDKVRNGRKWEKRAIPPYWIAIGGECPRCREA